jgi:hypothetical protein
MDHAHACGVMKKTIKVLPVLAIGLLAQTTPAHADGSIFSSISQAFHNVENTVRNGIDNLYGINPQDNTDCQTASASAAVSPTPAPLASPSPTGPDFSQCNPYLGEMYDPSQANGDPQKVATIYLNAALDYMSVNVDPDAKPSADEIAQRNNCVVLALSAGADPNGNGVYYNTDGMATDVPVPLTRAVNDNDEAAVKALLAAKASPNAVDSTMGKPIPLLKSSIYGASQDISIDLINAGADLTTPDLLWTAASNDDDQVVNVLLQTKQIPVNQVDKFTDFPDDPGETALDTSEQAIYALKGYQKKYPAGSTASVQDKIGKVNSIMYYTYPLKPQLKYPAAGAQPAVDPDAFVNDLLTRQQSISSSLKAAGWSCIEKDCGIVDLGSDDGL